MNDPHSTPGVDAEGRQVLRSFRLSRILWPVLLGLAAVTYLFYQQFDLAQFERIAWTPRAFAWIGTAFLLLVIRHIFYAFRLRSITGDVFSWRKSMELIVLWEFSSALTPTSKGGPFVMLFALTQERLAAGRTAAAVFYTMVCDAGFFVVSLPILLGMYGPSMLSPGMHSFSDVNVAGVAFFTTFALMTAYWSILVFLLFVKPQYAKRALLWLSRVRLLRRWSAKLERLGNEFTLAASEMRGQGWRYHLKVWVGTIGAWTCKFIMINCLILAIVPETPLDGYTQAFIYARMVAMFIIMAFSPTPGGAGLAELALVNFTSDYVPPGLGLVVALLWRGMAYYGYLLLGAVVVPAWIASKMGKSKR